MKFFHGTCFDSAKNILSEGFGINAEAVWNCSDTDVTYMAGAEKNDEEMIQESFYFAVSAAQIAAAFKNQMDTRLVVFEIDVPDEIREEWITEDTSTPNMYDCYEIPSDVLNDLIRNEKIRIKLHILEDGYNPNFRIFILPVNNKYLQKINDPVFTKAAELVQNQGIFLDDIIGCYSDDKVMSWQEAKENLAA